MASICTLDSVGFGNADNSAENNKVARLHSGVDNVVDGVSIFVDFVKSH